MNTTGPLEILVMIVLLLVVVGCAIVCVVAVRWLRRIALRVEEDQNMWRERDAAVDEREAAAESREAAAHERDAARRQAEHEAVLDLRQIQRRVALAEEELAKVRVESEKARTEEVRAQTEAAKAQVVSAEAQADAVRAQEEAARAQTDLFRAQSAAAQAQEEAAQDEARRATAPAEPDPGGRDQGGSLPAIEDADLVRDVLRRFVGDGLDDRRDDDLGGVDDLSSGDLAAILRRLGLPTTWGDGSTAEDVSVKGIDPRLLRRLQDLIPPEVMRRLTSGRGPGDLESIGDWIRSQIEKSMDEGHGGTGPGGSGREDSGAGRGAAGRSGSDRNGASRRPAGFQRDDSTDDRSDAVNDSDDEPDDLSDVLPDALTDSADVPEADGVTASPGGLDVSALIEEALRDRARRRAEEAPDADGDGEPGDSDTPPEPDED